MQKVSVNQIKDILDSKYAESEDKIVNLMFFGQEGYGRSSVIEEWINDKGFNLYSDLYPMQLYDEENGLLKPRYVNGRKEYILADSNQIEFLKEDNTIILNQRFNWGRNFEGDSEFITVLKDRMYKLMGREHNLSNMKMFIATAFPDDGLNNTTPIIPEVINQFEKYDVVPRLSETVGFLKKKAKSQLEWYKELVDEGDHKDEDNDLKKYRLEMLDNRKVQLEIFEKLEKIDGDMTPLFSPIHLEQSMDGIFNVLTIEKFYQDIESRIKRHIGNTDKYQKDTVELLKRILSTR